MPDITCVTTLNASTYLAFDGEKDRLNRQKHGISLWFAQQIDWSLVWSAPDTRRDYGELREIGFVPVSRRLYCVVFTQRGRQLRIISLRKASNREITRYEQCVKPGSKYRR